MFLSIIQADFSKTLRSGTVRYRCFQWVKLVVKAKNNKHLQHLKNRIKSTLMELFGLLCSGSGLWWISRIIRNCFEFWNPLRMVQGSVKPNLVLLENPLPKLGPILNNPRDGRFGGPKPTSRNLIGQI